MLHHEVGYVLAQQHVPNATEAERKMAQSRGSRLVCSSQSSQISDLLECTKRAPYCTLWGTQKEEDDEGMGKAGRRRKHAPHCVTEIE